MSSTLQTSGTVRNQLQSLVTDPAQRGDGRRSNPDPKPSAHAVINQIGQESTEATRAPAESGNDRHQSLRRREQELRLHEMAHASQNTGFELPTTFSSTQGTEQKEYVVGGSFRVDLTPVPGDLEATADKMQTIKRAAQKAAKEGAVDPSLAGQASARKRTAESKIAEQERLDSVEAPRGEELQDQSVSSLVNDESSVEQIQRLPRGTGSLGGGKDATVNEVVLVDSHHGTASVVQGSGGPAENAGGTTLRKGPSSSSGTDSLLAEDVEEGPLSEAVSAFDESHLQSQGAEVVSAPQEANELASKVQQRYYPSSSEGGILSTTA
jgi:hypothetical protein